MKDYRQSILVRIYLPEEYEDVHPELVLEDFRQNPDAFSAEVVDERTEA